MRLRSAIAFLMSLALVCPSTFAGSSTAMGRLTAEGKAQINRLPAPGGTTVFEGDLVSMEGEGLATISLSDGSRVLVTNGSGARLQRHGNETLVRIAQGTVAVLDRGENGLVMNAQGLLVRRATDAPTRYAVRIEDRAVVLTSVAGDLRVEGRDSSHAVPAGASMRFELAENPQGPAGSGAGTGLSTVMKVLIVTGITAAIVVPVVIANTGDDAVSP